jgi:hypothetical protein
VSHHESGHCAFVAARVKRHGGQRLGR